MHLGDTIIARSSPPGRSARALIRLSGPDAHRAVAAAGAAFPADSPAPGCGAARLRMVGGLELPVLWTRFMASASATGEDVAELLLPGNPALVDRVIDQLIAVGGSVRRAEPGEFTARAFLRGRLDLIQAEGVARMIAARTQAEREAAVSLLRGVAGARYQAWAHALASLLAATEAGIDFTDQEDVVSIAPGALAAGLRTVITDMSAILDQAAPSEASHEHPRVVLVGPPNAGKSTLFNALLGRRRAVVSEVAGSTRDVLVEPLDLSADVPGGPTIDLCDAPGLDADAGSPAHQGALAAIASADALVLCDPAARFELIETRLPPAARARAVLRVRTKADLPAAVPGADNTAGEAAFLLAVCALDGWRVSALRRAIADAAAHGQGGASDVLPRHRSAIAAAHAALRAALHQVDPRARSLTSPERIAALLREALDAVGQITGRTTTDDILGRIFASFCIGK